MNTRARLLVATLLIFVTLATAARPLHAQDGRPALYEPLHPGPALRQEVPPLDDDLLALIDEARWRRAVRGLDRVLKEHPGHLQALYYRAIAQREQAKPTRYFDKGQRPALEDRWTRAIDDFEAILAQDSLYADVLRQYAILWRYAERFERAVEFGQAQVRLRPELTEAHLELFNAYDHLVHVRSPRKAADWLSARSTDLDAYYLAEVQRLDGQLVSAKNALEALLDRSGLAMPRQPIELSLARIAYAQDQPMRGQWYVHQAIETIDDERDAHLVFEDVKHILSDTELETYRTLDTPEAYRDFFLAFWTKRDPMPARVENVRLTEHYRRLLVAERDYVHYGLRLWHNDPDTFHELEQPETYWLNEEFNDRGLVYIRHGEPGETLKTSGFGVPINESWRYYPAASRPDDPPMDFHFAMAGGGSNWRLTPALPEHAQVYVDREVWGGLYAQLASAARRSNSSSRFFDFEDINRRMTDQSRETVQTAFTTDRHTWPDAVEPLEIPHVLVAFRGEPAPGTGAERSHLELHYAVPNGALTAEARPGIDSLNVEVGIAVHDSVWMPVARYADTVRVPANTDPMAEADVSSAFVYRFDMNTTPGLHNVALHVNPLDSPLLGGYKFVKQVPGFTGPGLAISDLLPAYRIDVPADGVATSRLALHIVANPGGRFSVDQPVYMYFELYNLGLGPDDRTRYTIDYTLTPEGDDDARPRLSLKTTHAGTTTDPVEYAQLDVSGVSPGVYTLSAEVADLITGQKVRQTQIVTLIR